MTSAQPMRAGGRLAPAIFSTLLIGAWTMRPTDPKGARSRTLEIAATASEVGAPEEAEEASPLVVRLVRFDHGGRDALLQAEERWHSGGAAGSDGSGDAGASNGDAWRKLPPAQMQALRDHHASALLQTSSDSAPNATSMLQSTQSTSVTQPPDGHLVKMRQAGSQYVGPIGVGTTVVCKQQHHEEEAASSLHERPARFSSLAMKAGSVRSGKSCQARALTTMHVIHDTGSTNTWLFSQSCRDKLCTDDRRTRYDHSKSSSFVAFPDQGPVSITFGTGKIEGHMGAEDFHIGPYTVKNQQFGEIEKADGDVFTQPEIGGIAGYAFKVMSANGAVPLFDNIMAQKVLPTNAFGFWLSSDPSENAMVYGAMPKHFYKGPLSLLPVTDPYYWSVDMDQFAIGDEVFLGAEASGVLADKPGNPADDGWFAAAAAPFLRKRATESMVAPAALIQKRRRLTPKAIFDSGTTYFTAGGGLFERIMDRLPPKKCNELTEKSHPDLRFRLKDENGKAVDVSFSHEEYMVRSTSSEDSECRPAFMLIDVPKEHDGPSMIMGQVFNHKYVVQYDRGNGKDSEARVGVALAAHGSTQTDALRFATGGQAPVLHMMSHRLPSPA